MKVPCSTKDQPGGDACQLERGHSGPHDWQGGRPEGERHAKDFFGKSLYVGDEVATLMPAYRYTLVSGTVARITPKMLRVDIVLPDAPCRKRRVITVAERQVVKASR